MNRPLDFPNNPDRGDVFREWKWDGRKWVPLNRTGWAPIDSPDFVGMPTAPTPPPGSNDAKIATTAFVMEAIEHHIAGVASFNNRTGHVYLLLQDIFEAGGAPIHSPHFTGAPEADTPPLGDISRRLATTEFVQDTLDRRLDRIVESWNGRIGDVNLRWDDVEDVGGAPITNPFFFGAPRADTPPRGDRSTRLATTAFTHRAIDDEREDIDEEIDRLRNNVVTTWNQRKGHVTFRPSDLSSVGGAFLESPHFTGRPTAPTAPPQTDNDRLATTRYVDDAIRSNPGPPGPPGQRGQQGEPGQGFRLQGSVEDFDDLPTAGLTPGDVWITENNGIGWVWTGSRWQSVGFLRGPPGSANSTVSDYAPMHPAAGDFWTLPDNIQVRIWTGYTWYRISPPVPVFREIGGGSFYDADAADDIIFVPDTGDGVTIELPLVTQGKTILVSSLYNSSYLQVRFNPGYIFTQDVAAGLQSRKAVYSAENVPKYWKFTCFSTNYLWIFDGVI